MKNCLRCTRAIPSDSVSPICTTCHLIEAADFCRILGTRIRIEDHMAPTERRTVARIEAELRAEFASAERPKASAVARETFGNYIHEYS